jgi:hypothetical protein
MVRVRCGAVADNEAGSSFGRSTDPTDPRVVVGAIGAALAIVLLGGLAVALGIGSGAAGDGIAAGYTPGSTTTIPAYDLNGDGSLDIATVDGQVVAVPQPSERSDDGRTLALWSMLGVIGAAVVTGLFSIGCVVLASRSRRRGLEELEGRVALLEQVGGVRPGTPSGPVSHRGRTRSRSIGARNRVRGRAGAEGGETEGEA